MDYEKTKSYYDVEKRGAKAPDYSQAEMRYRSDRLTELQNSYVINEQVHMELNGLPYSQYYLLNRQIDMAYNPPKINPADSRIVSGYVHEKDQTIISVVMNMNFQPKVCSYDPHNKQIVEACQIFTAKIKKALILDNFRDKLENIARMLVSQGNAFTTTKNIEKWDVKKVKTSGINSKITWRTVYEKSYACTTTDLIPNTAIFPMNIMENDKTKQARIYYVMHYPVEQLARIFKNNLRWEMVPQTPTRTIPVNIDGVWGDYYLQMPIKNYAELIVMESEVFNEYQAWVNGVMMYPVQEENGLITGYPLTQINPAGTYTISKGDYERIPFFWWSKSNPAKNQVKEEELNEIMRLMVLMLRQKTQPSIGNMTNRVLPTNLWDPNMVISDIRKEDISVLNPNLGISEAEFNFYKMVQESIDDSTVSPTLEGQGQDGSTLGQYLDQKKESLKKLGLSLDRIQEMLKQIYWSVLFGEVQGIDQKVKKYNSDGTFVEAYNDFSSDDTIDGKKGVTTVRLRDDLSDVDARDLAREALNSSNAHRIMYAKPKDLQKMLTNMKDQIYIEVVSEPEGEQQSLLGVLFNLLTQYVNLKGGDYQKINFDYIETIISDNSGFDPNKLFLETSLDPAPTQPLQPGQGMPQNNQPRPSMVPQNINASRPAIPVL